MTSAFTCTDLRARCRFLNRIHTAIRENEKGVPQETLVQSTPISQDHPSHNIQVGLSCQEDAILGPTTPFTSRYAMWGRTKPADRPEWKALQSTHLTITRQGLVTSFEALAGPSEHLPRGTRQYRTRPSLSPPAVPLAPPTATQ